MSGDIHTVLPQCWCGKDHRYESWEAGYQYAREEAAARADPAARIAALEAALEPLVLLLEAVPFWSTDHAAVRRLTEAAFAARAALTTEDR